jgi:hypothetical protein
MNQEVALVVGTDVAQSERNRGGFVVEFRIEEMHHLRMRLTSAFLRLFQSHSTFVCI